VFLGVIRDPPMMDIMVVLLALASLTTVPLFLLSLLLAFTRPKRVTPPSPSSITAVVVSTVSPRRALLLTFFGFSAFTYLLDELVGFGFRQSHPNEWRAPELAELAGFLAFSMVIIIGLWKDRSGADLWLRKRLKAWLILAILLDIAYLVLLVLAVRIFKSRHTNSCAPRHPLLITFFVMQNGPRPQASPNDPTSLAFTFPIFYISSLSTSVS
jgi:ATP-binding cassette subfamily B (MDR/TAP) protein 6